MRCAVSFFALMLSLNTASAELSKISYGDWKVSCSKKNYCVAETPGQASNGEAFRLKIERGAKVDSKVYVSFDPSTELSVGLPARIEIESLEEENYGYFGKVSKVYEGNEMTFSGAADRELMEKLRLGKSARVEIEFGRRKGTISYEVSLNGITHALLKIDQEQNRIGRLDAIVAWGGLPSDKETGISFSNTKAASAQNSASSNTPVRDQPAAQSNEAQSDNYVGVDSGTAGQVYSVNDIPDAVTMIGYRTLNCKLEEAVPAFGAQFYSIADAVTWVIPCENADANVPYYMATFAPNHQTDAELYEFKTPPDFNQPNQALVNNLNYDPSTDQVTGTTYYSASADCGSYEEHVFEAESGQYTLNRFLEKANCDGQFSQPNTWPLYWTIDEMGN